MTRIYLVNPPGDVIRTGRLVRRSKVGTQSWPPIHLAYAAGVLEKYGYGCRLVDAAVTGASPQMVLDDVSEYNPEAVAVYWSYDTRAEDLAFAERIARTRRVFLVGPWSAHYPEALRDCPSVEAATFGQFEYTLPRLVERQEAHGVKYRDGGYTPHGDAYSEADLDWMPFVTDVYRRHLPVEKYHQTSFRHPFVDLYSSRGCVPGTCTFCSVNNGENRIKWSHRSLGNVMEELWSIKRTLPKVKQVFFQDDTLPTPWALKIAERIMVEGLDLCWGCYSRADKTYEEVVTLKEAGCRTFHVGYEFPDQKILDELHKGVTVEQMEAFAAAVRKAGMWTSSSFMVIPWASPAQMEALVLWIRRTGATRVNVAALQGYPGCPVSDTVKTYLDVPGGSVMSWGEMVGWEKRCFSEFYLRNPEFWWGALTSPREWRSLIRDGLGMLQFLSR